MIAGQASDMAFETCVDTSLDECVEMEGAKTGALLACAASIGALLSDADNGVVDALAAFGRELGLAFQAVDDLLGIWGKPEVTGKPTWSDLRSQKKTLPVVFSLSRDDARAEELRSLFSNGPLEEAQVARAARLVERCGGRELTEAAADRHLAAALDALGSARARTDRARGARRAGPIRDHEGILIVSSAADRRSTGRATRCSACRTARAGGRPSSRPTSPWTPRTCSCGGSSGSTTPT